MRTRVLVTGGAGFIGSHVVDLLLAGGYEVAILDSLVEQVHGPEFAWPKWSMEQKARGARLQFGDVRNRGVLGELLRSFRPHVVVHLAAEVGVGQAEVEIERYVDANVRGTAILLEEVLAANDSVADPEDGIRRLVVAGSMSSYGEGLWLCPEHGPSRPARSAVDLAEGRWVPRCAGPELQGKAGKCDAAMAPLPVEEWVSLRPAGVYAATKRDTEELALLVAGSRGLSTAVTRFFNVYGPRQSLGNPYTGVCAIFASRVLRGLAPRVYEDGQQVRDFVHVSDVARAIDVLVGNPETALAARKWADPKGQGVFNVGTGEGTSILRVAELACEALGGRTITEADIDHVSVGPEGFALGGRVVASEPTLRPEVTGAYRVGDVRACLAAQETFRKGPTRLRALGWAPLVAAEEGLPELFRSWRNETPMGDPEAAHAQTVRAGLLVAPSPAAPEEPAADEPTNRWGG